MELLRSDAGEYDVHIDDTNPYTVVWRYMNYWKFVQLMEKHAIYFCSVACLDEYDKHDGTESQAHVEFRDELLKRTAPQLILDHAEDSRNERERTFCNCWSMGDFESDPLWKRYIEDEEGLAIRSTVRRLQDACRKLDVEHRTRVTLTRVDYVDHPKHIGDGRDLDRYRVKDRMFRWENEFRIIYDDRSRLVSPKGLVVEIDLKTIVDQVVLQPSASQKLESEVRSLLQTLCLSFDVVRSRYDRTVRY